MARARKRRRPSPVVQHDSVHCVFAFNPGRACDIDLDSRDVRHGVRGVVRRGANPGSLNLKKHPATRRVFFSFNAGGCQVGGCRSAVARSAVARSAVAGRRLPVGGCQVGGCRSAVARSAVAGRRCRSAVAGRRLPGRRHHEKRRISANSTMPDRTITGDDDRPQARQPKKRQFSAVLREVCVIRQLDDRGMRLFDRLF